MKKFLACFWLIQVTCVRLLGGYVQDGNELFKKGDLDSAIAADTYFNRGNAKDARGDLNGAIADFTKTIATAPSQILQRLSN